jgi:beta-lactamase class A
MSKNKKCTPATAEKILKPAGYPPNKSKKRYRIFVIAPLLVVAGFCIGRATVGANPQPHLTVIRENDTRYAYIHPLLTFSLDGRQSASFQKLNDQISDIIVREKKAGLVDDVGFYFRNANTGEWTGVNEDDKFSPASLLKVQIMIATLKLAEADPTLLSKRVKVVLEADLNQNESFKSPAYLANGGTYSIDDLVRAMIVSSDNNAMTALQQFIGPKALQQVYDDLYLQIRQDDPVSNSTSPKTYSLTLRVLYNATYLSREMSNKAMALLTETSFNSGIEQGVPSAVKVAEKFGERTVADRATNRALSRELHDCGMIYYPDKPYVLCIMTQGREFDGLLQTIKEISASTYTFVENSPSPQAYANTHLLER